MEPRKEICQKRGRCFGCYPRSQVGSPVFGKAGGALRGSGPPAPASPAAAGRGGPCRAQAAPGEALGQSKPHFFMVVFLKLALWGQAPCRSCPASELGGAESVTLQRSGFISIFSSWQRCTDFMLLLLGVTALTQSLACASCLLCLNSYTLCIWKC